MTDPTSEPTYQLSGDDPTDPRLAAVPGPAGDATLTAPGGFGAPVPPPTPEPGADRAGGRVYGTGEVYGTPRQAVPAAPPGPEPAGPLPGADRGSTSIEPAVVEQVIEKIVSLTVADVEGVDGLHRSDQADGEAERPVGVTLDGEEARIALAIRVRFGHPVHRLVEQVRSRVVTEAERMLGLAVTEVNVRVADVVFEAGE